jgi:hypothetical protein
MGYTPYYFSPFRRILRVPTRQLGHNEPSHLGSPRPQQHHRLLRPFSSVGSSLPAEMSFSKCQSLIYIPTLFANFEPESWAHIVVFPFSIALDQLVPVTLILRFQTTHSVTSVRYGELPQGQPTMHSTCFLWTSVYRPHVSRYS